MITLRRMDEAGLGGPVGPVDARRVPRFAGLPTFARLPSLKEVGRAAVAVLGIPFDSGVTYRPGARFGPEAVRQASRLLRPYHPGLDIEPFDVQQVADAGDVACNPFCRRHHCCNQAGRRGFSSWTIIRPSPEW